MRTDPLATCELQFITQSFLDGQVKLILGTEPGTALATIGATKYDLFFFKRLVRILCTVSASLGEPSKSRPAKGVIHIEVDMSPMGNPSHESGRLGEKGIELTRLLELIIRDSSCIDVEALCIKAGKLVWRLRVDVRVLDDDGSLIDCATLAAAAALQHFRRPDLTVGTQGITVHSQFERPLIPLNIYHQPICVTLGFSRASGVIVMDPSERELLCLDGCLWIACNRRREVCALHQSSHLTLSTQQIRECIERAMHRAVDLGELVAAVVGDDREKRAKKEPVLGFDRLIEVDFLSSRESQPNELIAPAIQVVLTAKEKERLDKITAQSQIVQNKENQENVLSSNAIVQDPAEEQQLNEVLNQVSTITDSVQTLETEDEPPWKILKKADKKEHMSGVTQHRKKERVEAMDFLDDLEGETEELRPAEPQEEPRDVDLSSAVRKKKSKK